MNFRIYYGDGSMYEGDVDNIPKDNTDDVQVIAWNDPVKGAADLGRVTITEWDIYIYSDPIGWHGTNKYADLLMHLRGGIGLGGVRAVMTGRWISIPAFHNIREHARTDPGLDRKSANDPIREDGAQ